MHAVFIPTPIVFWVSKYLWLLRDSMIFAWCVCFEMILHISANLETYTLYTTQPPPSSSSFCLSEISDKKQVFTWIIQRVSKFVYNFIWEGWWVVVVVVGGVQPALCNLLRDSGLESRASQTLSHRVALSSFQNCSRATSLLLWRTAAAIERARAGSRSNTSQEVRRNMCSDSCRSIDSVSLVMKPPKHFPLKLATRAQNLSRWRDWSYFFCLASRRETNHAEH